MALADDRTTTGDGAAERASRRPTVALLPWGDLFADFLDRLGVGVDELRTTFTGSWMFGYASALATAGVRTVLVCPTVSVDTPRRLDHEPTGATIWLLPASRLHRSLRRRALRESLAGRRDPRLVAAAVAAHTAPYAATPPRALARVLRREGCEALLCQEYETPRFDVSVAVGRLLGIPVFATFQGGDVQHSRLERVVRPLSLRGAAGLVIAAEVERERVRGRYAVPETRVARIPNPVDTVFWARQDTAAARRELDLPPHARVVAWHGQVQLERKGLDLLLAAWARLSQDDRGPERRLLLAGSGEDVPLVLARLAEPGLETAHLLAGWADRETMRTVLSAADAYAFPSRREGFPVAPLEAMACGLPVVAADAQGLRDVVGEAGAVVPRGDASALADALARLLDDPALCGALGREARRRVVQEFSSEAVGVRLRALLCGSAGA